MSDEVNANKESSAKAQKLIYKLGRKIESVSNDIKSTASPSASAGTSQSDSGAFTVTRMIQLERLLKDVEKLKTSVLELSVTDDKNIDLNSDNVSKWFDTKFQNAVKSTVTRNTIREVVACKLDSFQVILL